PATRSTPAACVPTSAFAFLINNRSPLIAREVRHAYAIFRPKKVKRTGSCHGRLTKSRMRRYLLREIVQGNSMLLLHDPQMPQGLSDMQAEDVRAIGQPCDVHRIVTAPECHVVDEYAACSVHQGAVYKACVLQAKDERTMARVGKHGNGIRRKLRDTH